MLFAVEFVDVELEVAMVRIAAWLYLGTRVDGLRTALDSKARSMLCPNWKHCSVDVVHFHRVCALPLLKTDTRAAGTATACTASERSLPTTGAGNAASRVVPDGGGSCFEVMAACGTELICAGGCC